MTHRGGISGLRVWHNYSQVVDKLFAARTPRVNRSTVAGSNHFVIALETVMRRAVFAAGRCAEKIPQHMIDTVERHNDGILLRRRFVPHEPSSATGSRLHYWLFLDSGDFPVQLAA